MQFVAELEEGLGMLQIDLLLLGRCIERHAAA